jgi:phosphoserine phosphatase
VVWDPPVSRRLSEFLAAASPATVAAFDADGTLWSADVGEAFMRHAGETGLLKAFPKGDAVWTEYQRRLASGDLPFAFELCVTAFEGLAAADVEAAARAFVDPAWDEFVFPAMRGLVDSLHRAEADVWVVSASPVWCVIPGAKLLGIPPHRVIAAQPHVEGGMVQGKLGARLPAFEHKVSALVERAHRGPHFAAGNSEYDFALLESARALALLVNPPAGDPWLQRKNGNAWLVQKLAAPGPK